ncbi:MAG: hypothetical protein V3R64_08750 [Sphingomonadales bacterium]
MEKYDKTVIERRFRRRRKAREHGTGQALPKFINLFLGIFALGLVVVLAIIIFAFMG